MANEREGPTHRPASGAWARFETSWLTPPDAPYDPFGRPSRLLQGIAPMFVWVAGFGTAAARNAPALVLAGTVVWVVFAIARRGGFAVDDVVALIVGLCVQAIARLLVNPRPLSVQVSVPPSLPPTGLSGEVLASRLLDRPREWMSRPRAVRSTLAPSDPLPKIEIPGVKLPLDSLADLIRGALGRQTRIVTGEVIEGSDGQIELRLRDAMGGRVINVPARPRAEIATLIEDAWEPLVLHIAPYSFALEQEKQGKLHAALGAARRAASDQSVSARARARAYVLCWRFSVSMDQPIKEQRDCLSYALAEAPLDAVVLSIVAQHVAYDPACTAEQRRFWRSLGRAAGFWARSQTDTPEWEIPYIQQRGQSWRAKRDQAGKSVDDARAALIRACQSLRKLIDANLAPMTTMSTLAKLAGLYQLHVDSAERELNFSAQVDPDDSVADQRKRMLTRVEKIKRIRSQVPNARIEQAFAWMDNYDKLFVSIGETAKGMGRSLAELDSPREKAVRTAVVSVKGVLSLCKTLNEYRSSQSAVEAVSIGSWLEAVQGLKQALTDLQDASKRMSRLSSRQSARVHWCARSLTRLNKWLARGAPPKDAVEAWATNEAWFQRFIDEHAPKSASGGDESPAGK